MLDTFALQVGMIKLSYGIGVLFLSALLVFFNVEAVLAQVPHSADSRAAHRAITPLSYSPERSQNVPRMWHFGQIHAVSSNRLIINSGSVDLGLLDSRTGAYLKQLDTVAIYQFVEKYIDTSTHAALLPYKQDRLVEDSISYTRYQTFEPILPIPGSSDILVQSEVTYRPAASELLPWGVVHLILRVDTALNVVSIMDLVQDWRPAYGERVDSTIFRRLVGMQSEAQLIFYEPDTGRTDTLLRYYELVGKRYVPRDDKIVQGSSQRKLALPFKKQIKPVLYVTDGMRADSFFISTPSGKTLPLDTLQSPELSAHRYFDMESVKGTSSVVLLTGKPDERGYVASKTLSHYNVSTKQYQLLGTYEKATTKAYDVCLLEGVAYLLLYDDRRNRPLLHRVDLGGGKVFGM